MKFLLQEVRNAQGYDNTDSERAALDRAEKRLSDILNKETGG